MKALHGAKHTRPAHCVSTPVASSAEATGSMPLSLQHSLLTSQKCGVTPPETKARPRTRLTPPLKTQYYLHLRSSQHPHLFRLAHERWEVRRVALQQLHDYSLGVSDDLNASKKNRAQQQEAEAEAEENGRARVKRRGDKTIHTAVAAGVSAVPSFFLGDGWDAPGLISAVHYICR